MLLLCSAYPKLSITIHNKNFVSSSESLLDVYSNNNSMLLLVFAFAATFYTTLFVNGSLFSTIRAAFISERSRFFALLLNYWFLLIVVCSSIFYHFLFYNSDVVIFPNNFDSFFTFLSVDDFYYYRDTLKDVDLFSNKLPFYFVHRDSALLFFKFDYLIVINAVSLWIMISLLSVLSILCLKKEPIK